MVRIKWIACHPFFRKEIMTTTLTDKEINKIFTILQKDGVSIGRMLEIGDKFNVPAPVRATLCEEYAYESFHDILTNFRTSRFKQATIAGMTKHLRGMRLTWVVGKYLAFDIELFYGG